MTARYVPVLLLAGCVSAPPNQPPLEGTTASGIAYDIIGSGPTVVLIHGGVLDRRMWEYETDRWARSFRVVRYDLRGHGKSADITEPYSPVDDLREVLDAVGAPTASLVGLSLGSRVALDFTLTHPGRVNRLVLAAPFPSGMRPTEMPPGFDSLIAAARRGDIQRAAALTADMPAFAPPPGKESWVRGIVMSNARVYRQSPTAERPLSPPSVTRLAEVRVPTLVIYGDREVRDIVRAADTLTRGIPGSTRVVVPGAGHLVNVWKPELFGRAVRRFLRGERVDAGWADERLEVGGWSGQPKGAQEASTAEASHLSALTSNL